MRSEVSNGRVGSCSPESREGWEGGHTLENTKLEREEDVKGGVRQGQRNEDSLLQLEVLGTQRTG